MALDLQPLGSAEALRRLAAGRDAEAWVWILGRHGQDILRATARILSDPELAEDACQETLLQIRDRARQFRGKGPDADASARNWIMRIACNTALHMLRQRKRARQREDAQSYREQPVVIDVDQRQALAGLVHSELAELPDKQRQPLVLHFFANLSYDQIALELGCKAGAARVRVHRALQKLRERLAVIGVTFSISALCVMLENVPLQAAEAVLSPERMQQWQQLLCSSQNAAINVLGDEQVRLFAKAGYAAASALLAGSLAFGLAPKTESTAAPANLSVQRSVGAPDSLPQPPVELVSPARTENTRDEQVRSRQRTAVTRPQPEARGEGRDPKATRRTLPGVFGDDEMISLTGQLGMLQTLQHELNAQVAAIYSAARDDGHGGRIFSTEQVEMLKRAADDQAQIARLTELLAERLRQRRLQ